LNWFSAFAGKTSEDGAASNAIAVMRQFL